MDQALQDISRTIDALEAKLRQVERYREPEIAPLQPTLGELLRKMPATPPASAGVGRPLEVSQQAADHAGETPAPPTVQLDLALLKSHRIVAHNGSDPRSWAYDMLRTELLRVMRPNSWKLVGITSPKHGCGKTLTAINLAFSLSRQQEVDAVLVDLDLRRPKIAESLGLSLSNKGALGVLKDRVDLASSVVQVNARRHSLFVLPTAPADDIFGLIEPEPMGGLLSKLKSCSPVGVVIVNLSPILTSDDALKILPMLDCVVLTTGVRSTKSTEVEECLRYLRGSHLVRVVINEGTQ